MGPKSFTTEGPKKLGISLLTPPLHDYYKISALRPANFTPKQSN